MSTLAHVEGARADLLLAWIVALPGLDRLARCQGREAGRGAAPAPFDPAPGASAAWRRAGIAALHEAAAPA